MSRDGAGTYNLPAGQPVVTGTTISSSTHNTLASDLGTALTASIAKDGQTTPTANLTMGGFRLTSLGAATAVADAVRASQVQDNALTLLASVAGTNTITGTATPTPAAYASGQKFILVPANTNTGATTVNVSSLGAKNVFAGGVALVGGELLSGVPAEIEYDGTQFNIISNIGRLGIISPAQLAANTNDWAPTSLSTALTIRFSTDARRNITGLTGGESGRSIILHNVGTFPAAFKYEDTNSSAANRFAFGITLGGGQSMELQYDGTSSRWRAKATPPDPVGGMRDFAGGTVPEGYLACDATAVNRTTYAALFNEIGTTWGVGDGSTTFNLPDFRRRAAVGSGGSGTGTLGNAVGNTGGEETHAQTIAEMASHDHQMRGGDAAGGLVSYADAQADTFGAVNNTGAQAELFSAFGSGADLMATTGSGTAFNVIQPSAVVTKIVKF